MDPTLTVECYAGHRGEQTPRALTIAGRRVIVEEVLKGDDGDTYLVRQDTASGLWELTMFRSESRSS